MSSVLFRQRVAATLIQAIADWTGDPFDVEYENHTQINPASQTRPFVLLDIVYLDGDQKDLSDKPLIGTMGQIYITVAVQQFTGTRFAEELRDFLAPYFELKNWAEGVTAVAEPQKDRLLNGWVYFPVLFNFTQYRHTLY